jgi:hypothetical protein
VETKSGETLRLETHAQTEGKPNRRRITDDEQARRRWKDKCYDQDSPMKKNRAEWNWCRCALTTRNEEPIREKPTTRVEDEQ